MPAAATFENERSEGSQLNSLGEVDASSMHTSHETLREACADVHTRVSRFLTTKPTTERVRRTQEQTRVALSVIDKALRDYDFKTISISYNGGKDCLVLLVLYLSALHTFFSKPSNDSDQATSNHIDDSRARESTFPTSIASIYAKPPDPFPQVSSFVDSSAKEYHLDLSHISTNPGPNPKYKSHTSPPATVDLDNHESTSTNTTTQNGTLTRSITNEDEPIVTFRDAFALYLQANPQIQAIFVGTRRTDPHGGKLTHFDMTDGNWPKFIRIHPVIDWQLSDVWTFLKHPALADPVDGSPLQYCPIYDLGYTSLGGVGDTVPNPKLRFVDGDGDENYRPAYEMMEDDGERLGRE